VLSPAVDESAGVIVATEGTVRRGAALVGLDPATGQTLWRMPLPHPATTAMTVSQGQAILGLRDHRLYDIDLATRSIQWRVALGGVDNDAPAVAGGRVFVTASSTTAVRSRLVAIDLASGRPAWTFQTAGFTSLAGSPSVAGTRVFAGFGDAVFRAFDAGSGRLLWSAPLREFVSPFAAAAVAGGTVYANDRSGGLYALNATTGKRRWDFQFASTALWGAPLIARGAVLLGLDDGTVGAVDRSTGRLVWATRIRFGPIGALAASQGELIAPLLGGNGGVAAFRHDPHGSLRSVTSPSALNLGRAIVAFAAAMAITLAAVSLLFRFVLDRDRRPEGPLRLLRFPLSSRREELE
jgi:outer membrane protein assembly factor BamB